MSDTEKQDRINELLKDEAFWQFDAETDDASLIIEYDILFKNNKYLCVNYAGMFFGLGAAHPNHLFYAVNIDMTAGQKLSLSDIVNIDSAFVDTVRDYFKLYINENIQNTVKLSNEVMQAQESAFILQRELDEKNEEDFLERLMKKDSGRESSFYFTDDVFGFSFGIEYVAGDHYEIEIRREDMEKHLIVKDLFD